MTRSRLLRTLRVVCLMAPMLAAQHVAVAQEEAPARPERPQRGDRAQQADQSQRLLDNVEIVQNVVYATITSDTGDERELQLDAAFPGRGGDEPLPAVIYIHGGGWSGGHRSAGLPFTVIFANGGYFACTISYRLSGEATYPAAVHDCRAAVRFLRANADELGIDPARIGVWGHSAGGHLSAMLGLTGDDPAFEGSVGATGVRGDVACFVSVCGPTALAGFAANGMVAEFLGGNEQQRAERAVEASPLTHVDADDPPSLLVHGTDDELVNIRQAHMLSSKLTEAGVECELHVVEGVGHAIRDLEAYVKVAAFFDDQLGGSAANVFEQSDWRRWNELRPPAQPSPPDRSAQPQQEQGDREAPGDIASIPPALDEAAIKTMSADATQDAMAAVARALQRSPNLEGATRDRLRNEFRLLAHRLRELDDESRKTGG